MSRTMVSHTPSFAWHAQEVSSAQSVLLLEVMSHVCPSSLPESGTRFTPYLYSSNALCPTCPTFEGGKADSMGGPLRHPLPSYELWSEKSGTSGTDCLSALLFIEITCPALFLKGGTAPPRAPPVANQATGGETKNPVPRCW